MRPIQAYACLLFYTITHSQQLFASTHNCIWQRSVAHFPGEQDIQAGVIFVSVHSQAAQMIAGAFAQSVNPALIANQFASINALSQSQVQATGVTYTASTTITMPGAAIDTTV